MPSQTFAELGVSNAVVTALKARGVSSPFAVQELVLPDVLAKHDVLVKSPTGSGKTLAFGIPMVDLIEATDQRPSALILAPTRELAGQIVEEIRDIAHSRALSVAAVYGGAGIERQRKQARKAHILVATPGRLEDLLARRAFELKNIKCLVLDEADRMLDMGFRPAVDRIVNLTPSTRQTLFFSATLDGEVGRVANAYTTNARSHEHIAPAESRGDIKHRFVRVTHELKVDALMHELTQDSRGRTLVFVRTKRGADRLTKRLVARDVKAVAMHGDKSQSQRERALARFDSGKVDTLIATDVAARGIDVDDVTHVINFDPPAGHEDYVHRVGRTGRAGRTGTGITFVMGDQARDVSSIVSKLKLTKEFVEGGFSGSDNGGGNGKSKGRGSRPRRSSNGRSSEGRSANGRSSEGRSSNGRSSGRRSSEGRSSEGRSSEGRSNDRRSADGRSSSRSSSGRRSS